MQVVETSCLEATLDIVAVARVFQTLDDQRSLLNSSNAVPPDPLPTVVNLASVILFFELEEDPEMRFEEVVSKLFSLVRENRVVFTRTQKRGKILITKMDNIVFEPVIGSSYPFFHR